MRHIAINILTNDKVFKAGLRRKMRKAAMDRNYLASVLTGASLFRILCKYLFSEVAVQAVTELDNKAAHCHTPVPQWHRPFL
ncbi:H repeat-associated protein ydcC [Escherichia coli M919]|nr:H repeat-associated protein ydcC [Escherichia coli M919]